MAGQFGHAGRLYACLYTTQITADMTFCQVNIETARRLLRATFDSPLQINAPYNNTCSLV